MACWAQIQFKSYRFALAYLQGARVQAIPAIRSVGNHSPGDRYQTTISLRNHGTKPITLVGALVECTCVANDGLPASIPAGQEINLPISIHFGRTPGEWREPVFYLTNDPRQPTVNVVLDGRIVPDGPPPQ